MEDSGSEEDSDHSLCLDLGITIRRARLSDINDIARIYSGSIGYLDAESRDWIEGVIKKKSKRARFYVAVNSGVVGFILVYKKRNRAYIDAFAIDERYRGRGIGSCLLSYVEGALYRESVERVYLTVKNGNHRALGMYIKNGYKISNMVLLLKAITSGIGLDLPNKVVVRIDSVKRSFTPKTRLLDVTIWSNFTWDVDEAIYKTTKEEALVVTVYRGRRLLGVARVFEHRDSVVVERLALSFYRPTESLKIMISAIASKLSQNIDKTIVVPVDSTKSSLLRTLISMGFRVADVEYVLYKDLTEENKSQELIAIAKF